MGKKDWTKIVRVGNSTMIRIPHRIRTDPKYPFKKLTGATDELSCEIKGKELVFRKE